MSKTVWHKGPPPSIGWWPTKLEEEYSRKLTGRNRVYFRWWDGLHWSCGAVKGSTVDTVNSRAMQRNGFTDEWLQWKDRPASWPARSRT